MRVAKVSHEDFVVAWCTSETVDDVVKETGMTKVGVLGRAKVLRQAGVNLPKLKRPSKLTDRLFVAQLNSLVNKHGPKAVV